MSTLQAENKQYQSVRTRSRGCSTWKMQSCPENIYIAFVTCVFFFLLFFFHLTYSRWTSPLPSCLWSQRIFPSLPGSRLPFFLSRCKFSTLTTRQPMVEFYLLTFPRFPLRKKEHKSYFGKNRTHDFRTSRCAAYLVVQQLRPRYISDAVGGRLHIQFCLHGTLRPSSCIRVVV